MPAVNKKSPNAPLNAPAVDNSGYFTPIWKSFLDHFHSKTVADLQAQLTTITETVNTLAVTVTRLDETVDELLDERKRNGISASNTIPTEILIQTNNGAGVTVTMIAHRRRYDDGLEVEVNEKSVDLPYSTIAGFYYIDPDRAGGDVELLYSLDLKTTRHNYIEGQHSLGPIETMADISDNETGWLTGAVAAAGSWIGAANASTPNDVYASQNIAAASTSPNALVATGFGAAIPAGATITGISVRVKRYGAAFGIEDASVRLLKAGAAVGDDKAAVATSWPTSNSLKQYGASDDLWGAAWTDVEVEDPGFGVTFNAKNVTAAALLAYVDSIEVNIAYTSENTTPVASGGSAPPGWNPDPKFNIP